jgi:hypothetical protein
MPDEHDRLTPKLRASLRIVTDTLPMLESPDFSPGAWHEGAPAESFSSGLITSVAR